MGEAEPQTRRSVFEAIESLVEQARKRTLGAALNALAGAKARRNEATFSIALIALSAKIAKADGQVTDDETGAFQRFFQYPEEEASKVRMIYNLAQQDVAGFDHYLVQVARLFEDNAVALEDVLDCLFHIATADGVEHPTERALLESAAKAFNLSGAAVRRLRATHFGLDAEDPFAILGVPADANAQAIKVAYRALIREHHPDALTARGVPAAMIKVAEARSAAINAAYEKALAIAS
ncbi:MAG: DnaJ family molecular chaperone [Parvularculaceae bacterium]